MPSPRTSAPSTAGTDALLSLLFGVIALAPAFGLLAWLCGNVTNLLFTNSGTWAPFRAADALLRPGSLWPQLNPIAVLIGARIAPALAVFVMAMAALAVWLRWHGAQRGLARKADLSPLLTRESTAKAQALRPSLSSRRWKRGHAR